MDAYLGQIQAFPYNGDLVPSGWAPCNGGSLSIRQFTALYAIIGTTYGGDGVTSFKLPDLQGRVASGAGYGGAPALGQPQGTATVVLDQTQIGAHTHGLVGSTQVGTVTTSSGGAFAATAVGQKTGTKSGFNRYSTSSTNVSLAPGSLVPSGSGTPPHNNMQPYLGMTYFICIRGIFPPRS